MPTLSEHCDFVLMRMSQGLSLDEAAQELRQRGVSDDDIVAVRMALPSSAITGRCQQCGATIPQPGEDQCQQCYAGEQDCRLRQGPTPSSESRPMPTQSDMCRRFVRMRSSQGVTLEAALCELELRGVPGEVTSSVRRAIYREGKMSGYGATGETWDERVDYRHRACEELKSHLEFVRSRMAQGASLSGAAIELAKTGVRKRVVICVCRVVLRGSISAAIDELVSAMLDRADESKARLSRLQSEPHTAEMGQADCHPVRLCAGLAGLVLGGVIQFCNMSELFPTFPFAGLIVMAFGGYILSGGTKEPSH